MVAVLAVAAAVVSAASAPSVRVPRGPARMSAPAPSATVTAAPRPGVSPRCGTSDEPIAAHLVGLDFVGASVGYGFASVPPADPRGSPSWELVATHDGGRTWVARCPSAPGVFSAGYLAPSLGWGNLSFVDAATGYLWGQPGVAVTGDGGRRWARSFTGDVTGFAASGSSAWAAVTACHQGAVAPVCRTTVVDTRDSGATWQPMPAVASPRAGRSVAVAATGTGTVAFAVLPAGPITVPETVATMEHIPGRAGLRSLAPLRCPAYTTGVGLHVTGDGEALWATCRGGGNGTSEWLAISRSADGGASWHAESSAGPPFSGAVAMGFPCTAGGWQPSHLAPASATTAALVEMFGNSTVGTAGVYVTTDGGASWQLSWPLPEAPGGGAKDAAVDFVTVDLGWLAVPGRSGGPRGQLLETTDGGATWHLVPDRADVTGLGRGR